MVGFVNSDKIPVISDAITAELFYETTNKFFKNCFDNCTLLCSLIKYGIVDARREIDVLSRSLTSTLTRTM